MRRVLSAQRVSVLAVGNAALSWVGRRLASHEGRSARRWFVRAPALLLLVAAVAAWSGGGRPATPSTRSTSVRSSQGSAGLRGGYVIDLTWISDDAGWALAAAPCSHGLCLRIARTEDGGRTWSALPDPPAYLSASSSAEYCDRQPCVDHLRFATATVGYLFGPSLLITHNGGMSWTRVMSPWVESLEPGPGEVVRIVYNHDGCPGPCQRKIEAALAGSDDWRVLRTISLGQVSSDAVSAEVIRARPRAIYVAIYGNVAAGAGTQQTTIYRSLDAGRSWARLGDTCGGAGVHVQDAIAIAATPDGFLAALCLPRTQLGATSVTTSSDEGRSWSPRHAVPQTGDFRPDVIAVASPTDLVISNSLAGGSGPYTYTLMLSTDGGTRWSSVVSDREQLDPNAPQVSYLGFQDSLVGRWVGYPHATWTTADGGLQWTQQLFP